MAKIDSTEKLIEIDEKDNLRIVNEGGLKLCFLIKGKDPVLLTRERVGTLIDHLIQWHEHGDLEIPDEPEPI
jgi:hypothetical protein